MSKSFYDYLGIERTATAAGIKRAYRKLALKYHPDRPNGDEEMFKKINTIYTLLSNAKFKLAYDVRLASGQIPPSLEDLDREFSSNSTDHADQTTFHNWHRRTRNAYKESINTIIAPLTNMMNAFESMIDAGLSTEKAWKEVIKSEKECALIKANQAAQLEIGFNHLNFDEERIKEDLEYSIGKNYFKKRGVFERAFLRQFDIEFMMRAQDARWKKFDNNDRKKYYDLLDKITHLSEPVLSFVQGPIFIDALKTGVITFKDLMDHSLESLVLILTPACITALKEHVIKISQLNPNNSMVLSSLLQPNSLIAIQSKGQYYRKFFFDIENSKYHISEALLARIYTPECIYAVFSFLITLHELTSVGTQSPEKINYLLSAEFLAAYGKTKRFRFSDLKTFSAEDLGLLQDVLKTTEFLTILDTESCDVDIEFMLTLKKTSPEKWNLIFSEDGVNAILQEELSVGKLSAMRKEALDFALSPSKAMCFGALVHCGILKNSDTMYAFSKKELERMLEPAYVECCLKLEESGVLDDLSEDERDTNPVAYGLLKQINFDSLLTEISRIEARFHENNKASLAKKTASETLKRAFHDAKQRFVDSDDPLNDYAQLLESCKVAICQSKPELEKHRGWKKIGADLINFMIACINNILPLGLRFNLFDNKARSLHQIERLEQQIEQIPLPQCI